MKVQWNDFNNAQYITLAMILLVSKYGSAISTGMVWSKLFSFLILLLWKNYLKINIHGSIGGKSAHVPSLVETWNMHGAVLLFQDHVIYLNACQL